MEKYLPQKINQIIGHEKQIKDVLMWLKKFWIDKNKINVDKIKKTRKTKEKIKEFNDDDDSANYVDAKIVKPQKKNYACLLITGNHGVGKSVTINTILKANDYGVLHISTEKNKSKDIKKNVDQLLNGNTLNYFSEKKSRYVILIDSLENINSTIEKTYVNMLFKMNNDHWKYPLIIISNGKHSKLLHEIRKKSKEIKFYCPYDRELSHLLDIVLNDKNIIISETSKNNLIKYCQQDVRKLVNTILDLSNIDGKISDNTINEYLKTSNKKNIDFDLFKITDDLFYNYQNMEDCNKKYKMDAVMLPLMIHQNYKKSIHNTTSKFNDVINDNSKISRLLSVGDIIDNYKFGEQLWELSDVHGFYSCIYPSFVLSSMDNFKIKFDYPDDLNRTSIKKKKKKNIITNNKIINNFEIEDLLRLSCILKDIFTKYDLNDCVRILKSYNITFDVFDMTLKVNNMGTEKILISQKQKKELKQQLG